MMEAMERETVTRLGTREGAGLLILSSLQRVELHRHRVWRCSKFNIPSEVYKQMTLVTTHHNEPILRPLGHGGAAEVPG